MVLALALWHTAGDAFAGEAVNGGNVVNQEDIGKYAQVGYAQSSFEHTDYVQAESCISMPQLPYLPDAELAGGGGQSHLLTYSRIQRLSATEYIFSLKSWVHKLARRAAVLSLHREKLYDAVAHYRCEPVCEYYVFTLRRILI